ncbi:MAG: quinone-dependent dihydroorotate dehydrogenase [Gammaproteobacteria bacterium]|nr:quinone-dependent dihydroorotate dehydrogenase [Gammaproteobacteria bacterium]
MLRKLLFRLDAEFSHHLVFSLLRALYRLPGVSRLLRRHTPSLPVEVMGLKFPNPIGLAAGLDKNADLAPILANFGFGFLELGSVTPRPQPGNPRPRLFRLPAHRALINRMGFNSAGLAQFLNNEYQWECACPIGINIGKNKDTPLEHAVEDYLIALRAVYPHAAYVAINISSPNTPGLRELQNQENFDELLRALKTEQAALAKTHDHYVPMAVKIAPDLDDDQIAAIATLVQKHRIDAVIATNTTITRPGLEEEKLAQQAGGLSGRPLKPLSTGVIRKLYGHLQGKIPIIGVGGIETVEDAWEKLVAGADLVQIYSVLIYEGPDVVRKIIEGLAEKVSASGCITLADAIAKARCA